MDPLPEFSFLDAKTLSELVGILLIWVQWSKDLVPEPIRKYHVILSSICLMVLIHFATGGLIYAKLALYALVAASVSGLGYKILTSVPHPEVKSSTGECQNFKPKTP